MPENDDRITSFVDRDGFESDKKYVIDVLNQIKGTIKDLEAIKLTVFGSSTISQVIASVKLLNDETKKLEQSRLAAAKIAVEEEKRHLLAAKAALEEARAVDKLEQAKRRANAPTKGSGGSGGNSVADDASAFKQLQAATKAAKDEFNSLIIEQRKGLGATIADVDAARDKWKDLEIQMKQVAVAGKGALSGTTDIAASKEIDELKNKISALQRPLSYVKQEMRDLAKSSGGSSTSRFKQLSIEAAEYQGKIKLLQAELRKLSSEERERQSIASQAGKLEREILKEVGAVKIVSGEYGKLVAQLNALQAEGRELAAVGLTRALTAQETANLAALQTKAQDVAAALAKIDNQLGKGTRSNIAYTQQLFSLQQVLRETPNIAFGLNVFLASLSNNIPILADDLKRLAERNRELQAAGRPTVTVLSQVFKALFSLTSLIAIAVAVFTIFGERIINFIGNLFRSEAAIRANFLASKKYLEIQKQLSDVIGSLIDSQKKLTQIASQSNDDAIRGIGNQIKAMEALGVSIDKVFALKEKLNGLRLRSAEDREESLDNSLRGDDAVTQQFALDAAKADKDRIEKDIKRAKRKLQNEQGAESSDGDEIRRLQKELVLLDGQLGSTKEKILDLNDAIANPKVFSIEERLADARAKNNKKITDGDRNLQLLDFQLRKDLELKSNKGKSAGLSKDDLEKLKMKRDIQQKDLDNAQKQKDLILDVTEDKENALTAIEEQANIKRKFMSDEGRAIALSNAKEAGEQQIAINEKVLDSDRSTAKEKLAAVDAIRDAQKSIAIAERNNITSAIGVKGSEAVAAENELGTKLKNIDIETGKKRLAIQDEYLSRRLTAERETLQAISSYTIRIENEITEGTVNNLQQRSRALFESFKLRKELLRKAFTDELQEAGFSEQEADRFADNQDVELAGRKKTFEELHAMRVKFNRDNANLVEDGTIETFSLLSNEFKRNEELISESADKIGVVLSEKLLGRRNVVEDELDRLRELFIAKQIGVKEFSEKSLLVSDTVIQANLALIRQSLEEELTLYANAATEKIRLEQEYADARKALEKAIGTEQESDAKKKLVLAKSAYQQAIDFYKRMLELLALLKDNQKEVTEDAETVRQRGVQKQIDLWENLFKIINEVETFGRSIAEANFSRRLQMIDEEMAAIDAKASREKEIIEQSLLSEEEKQRRLKELDIKTANQKAIQEAKARKLERDKAIADKAFATLKILTDLAATIVKLQLMATLNPLQAPALLAQIPYAVASAGIGIASIAAIPLPKLRTGTADFQGGQAILGDGGKSELVIEPDGTMFRTGDTASVYSLKKHSVVLPDANSAMAAAMMMAKQTTDTAIGLSGLSGIGGFEILDNTMKSGFTVLASTIKNKPEILLRRGMNKDLLMRYGADYWKYIN